MSIDMEHQVFESLCLDPELRGYSYEDALLVDLARSSDFEEMVIKLTTKCNSILTQFRSLKMKMSNFSVCCASVCRNPREPVTVMTRRTTKQQEIDTHPLNIPVEPPKKTFFSKPEVSEISRSSRRRLEALEHLWESYKDLNYSGMVAIAVISDMIVPQSVPKRNHAVNVFTKVLLEHIHTYFMFQDFHRDFKSVPKGLEELQKQQMNLPIHRKNKDDYEYVLYLVYKLKKPRVKNTHRFSEVEKLEMSWGPFLVPLSSKRRHESGDSSASTSSSIASSSSSSCCFHSPATRSSCQATSGCLNDFDDVRTSRRKRLRSDSEVGTTRRSVISPRTPSPSRSPTFASPSSSPSTCMFSPTQTVRTSTATAPRDQIRTRSRSRSSIS
ncbi:uncharacterized protein LOC143020109 [Oratosquilla oratoria]|uniref:uncharacterized protein LOC143020109 n=1 Tax=Oratosquilla oratoria TaxID=337810 RepID=UPI003F75E888